MLKTSRLVTAAAACLLTGGVVMAQTASPAAGTNATGMNGAGTPGAGLGGAGTGGTDPAEPGKAPPMGSGTGTTGGTTKPADASAGMRPAPRTGTKTTTP